MGYIYSIHLLHLFPLLFLSLAFFLLSPGKSALHWAAAVNNVEAAMVLLKNGANKDMQNNKVNNMAALQPSDRLGTICRPKGR